MTRLALHSRLPRPVILHQLRRHRCGGNNYVVSGINREYRERGRANPGSELVSRTCSVSFSTSSRSPSSSCMPRCHCKYLSCNSDEFFLIRGGMEHAGVALNSQSHPNHKNSINSSSLAWAAQVPTSEYRTYMWDSGASIDIVSRASCPRNIIVPCAPRTLSTANGTVEVKHRANIRLHRFHENILPLAAPSCTPNYLSAGQRCE